jgi:general secretion pathway protein G
MLWRTNVIQDCFGETPKPARETRALPRAHAFTLVELLVVMVIILILAGLILATSSYVQKKGYRSRAEAEIAAISAALENYKADNGVYPRDVNSSDQANPTGSLSDKAYTTASVLLYEQLFGASNGARTPTSGAKTYFPFKPNMLNPPPPSIGPVTSIRDPFGNAYGYSTAKAATPGGPNGFNPTFDLWSIADGAVGTDQTKWVKNW